MACRKDSRGCATSTQSPAICCGVVYAGSRKKLAEHGDFSHDDTNVIMQLPNPSVQTSLINTLVETAQVAPTILKTLGLDSNQLQSVQIEGTPYCQLPSCRL